MVNGLIANWEFGRKATFREADLDEAARAANASREAPRALVACRLR